jgi:DnaJ-class molecular chaperone
MKCKNCDGSSLLNCKTCSGEGFDFGNHKCNSCSGEGVISCSSCEGKGTIGFFKWLKSS